MKDIQIPIRVGGVTFKNPFYVASGPTTKTVEQLVRIEQTGWAAASIKLTIDPAPYINRKPRYAVFPQYHALGFTAEKRLAFEEGLKLVSDAKKKLTDLVLLANITYSGDAGVPGWVNMAKKFEEAGADIIELNMCCPNMSYNVELTTGDSDAIDTKTGASLGQHGDVVSEIVRAIKKETGIPLFVKLTPEGGEIAQVAKDIYAAGADAVGGTGNRLGIPPMDIDHPEKAAYHLQDEISMSCYSGSWLKPLALRDTYEMRIVNGMNPAIMATGGVTNWRDAVEMILCGADLVGICAETLISGYDIVRPMIRGLKEYMDKHGYTDPAQFRGIVVPEVKTAPEVTLYGGWAEITNPNLYAPCKSACPIHVPAQGYIQKTAQGAYREAFDMMAEKGPLQRICGLICESPCERACVRGRVESPIKIREIKNFLYDYADKAGIQPDYGMKPPNDKKAAVVGSGATGLAAAFELRRAGYDVTVYDREREFGGSLRAATPRFRLDTASLDKALDEMKAQGIVFEGGATLGQDLLLDALRQDYDAVVLAIGAGKTRPGGLPDEDAEGVFDTVEYIRVAPKAAGKRAVVIGNKADSIDAARLALRRGYAEVMLVCGGAKENVAGLEQAVTEGVKVLDETRLRGFVQQMDKLTGVTVAPAAMPENDYVIACDIAVYPLDRVVDESAVDGLDCAQGRVVTTDGATSLDKVYCAGSAVKETDFIGSVAAGVDIAQKVDVALMGKQAALAPPSGIATVKAKDVLRRNGYIEPDRNLLDLSDGGALDDDRHRRPLTGQEAQKEAARCLNCGCGEGCQLCKTICCDFAPFIDGIDKIGIDKEKCVACGMCYNRCPNGNIEMISTGQKV